MDLDDEQDTFRRQETVYEKPLVPFSQLEMHRIIGTGQFGQVRLVRNRVTKEVYALKQMWKSGISEAKQMEHVANERKILEQAKQHPFCVSLLGAYQDKKSLYLLQVGPRALRVYVRAYYCFWV